MSTAILSNPCEAADYLHQQSQKQSLMNTRRQLSLASLTPAQQEILGSLMMTNQADLSRTAQSLCGSRSRNSSGGSNTSSSSNSSVPKFTTAPNAARMISFPEGASSSVNALYQPTQLPARTAPRDIPMSSVSYRKLDRSMSEPVDRFSATSPSSPTQKNVNSTRYKTELCRPYEESGFCKYGDKCQFAHGEHELRSLNRHPKYKTELCRTFHTVGFCPYGPRCHFIHNEDERKLSQIVHLKQQQVCVQQQQQHQAQQQQLQAVQQLLAQAQQQVQAQQAALSKPTTPTRASTRPTALDFAASLPPMVRDTLGSTADSPPLSLTGSPTASPTSMLMDQDWAMLRLAANTPPPQSAPPGFAGFQFQDAPMMSASTSPRSDNGVTPLNIKTSTDDAIVSLAAGLKAASLQMADRDAMIRDVLAPGSGVFMTPSPPTSHDGDSFPTNNQCESPIDLARGIRLPIFSGFAAKD